MTRTYLVRPFNKAAAFCVAGATLAACGSFARVPEQTYLGASYNWAFRDRYPHSDRLFNAFDYGHAILYEHLLRDAVHPESARPDIEGRHLDFITQRLPVHPPALPPDEPAVGPTHT